MRDLSFEELEPLTGDTVLNLLRRGADGSLRLSADRWRLESVTAEAVIFRTVGADLPEQQALEVRRAEIARVTWDRLPRQQSRSQLRFHLLSGDLWTFSGSLPEPAGE